MVSLGQPTLPRELRWYYPRGVACPICGERLHLRLREATGRCADCAQQWSFAALIDRAAQRLMEEPPRSR